jgi:hypothetical protein
MAAVSGGLVARLARQARYVEEHVANTLAQPVAARLELVASLVDPGNGGSLLKRVDGDAPGCRCCGGASLSIVSSGSLVKASN